MAASHPDPLARIHALWTLEGLGALTPQIVRAGMADPDLHVRVAAIRVAETLYKTGEKDLAADIRRMALDADPSVAIQSILTANLLQIPDAAVFIRETTLAFHSKGVQEIGRQLMDEARQAAGPAGFSAADLAVLKRGRAIYQELCFSCHGNDGKGMPMEGATDGSTLGPPLAGSATVNGTPDGMINVVMHGLTGPVNGRTYEALMVPMGANEDAWLASVISYIRTGFGNTGGMVAPAEVASVRKTTAGRNVPWTLDELHAALPHPLPDRKAWKLTASHGKPTDTVINAVDGNPASRYTTGAYQVPGMWFQIELPKPTRVTGLLLECVKSPRDYPRGYEVTLSDDGKTWGKPVAKGRGKGPVTEIDFKPATARFIRITETGSVKGLFWSIHELQVLEPGDIKLATRSVTPVASPFE